MICLKNLIHFIQKREKSKAENIAEKMIKRNLLIMGKIINRF